MEQQQQQQQQTTESPAAAVVSSTSVTSGTPSQSLRVANLTAYAPHELMCHTTIKPNIDSIRSRMHL
jgi:hypothetical protein